MSDIVTYARGSMAALPTSCRFGEVGEAIGGAERAAVLGFAASQPHQPRAA